MVHLQKLHETHGSKDLVVLGFDSADNREIGLDFIRKNKLTFPSVLDSSTKAMLLASKSYRAAAVPTTYVIDRKGKIAASWIGYREGDPQVAEALEKLGIR